MSGRFLYCQNCGNYLGSLGGDSCHCGWNAGSDPDDDPAVMEAAPAVPAATQPLSDVQCWEQGKPDSIDRAMAAVPEGGGDWYAWLRARPWATALYDRISAKYVSGDDAKEIIAALAALPAVVQGDGASADEVIQLAQALEQRRAIGITEAVNSLAANYVNETFRAGFESACEEITHRLRTEEWELCLPPSGSAGAETKSTGEA